MLKLRPHHGLCILNFTGSGYSEEFTQKMTEVVAQLRQNPKTMIEVTKGCDELCGHCPNRTETGCSSEHPDLFDGNVLARTGFAYEQQLTWQELISKTSPLSLDELDTMCPDCQWLEFCKSIAGKRKSDGKNGTECV